MRVLCLVSSSEVATLHVQQADDPLILMHVFELTLLVVIP